MIVTPYTPGVEEEKEHDAVAGDGGNVTLGGHAVVRSTGLVGVNVTVPVNVPTAVTVTVVAAPVAPVLKFTGVIAEIRKSEGPVTVAVTKAFLDTVPTAPIAATV